MSRFTTTAVMLAALFLAITARAENIIFPADAGLVDVTQPPYALKGDGKTDNTAALQAAFDALKGSNRTLYFPNGVYLLSDRVSMGGVPHSKDRFLHFQGQSQAGTILRLKDRSAGFDNPEKPKVMISMYDGKGTGDVMHSYVRNLTVDVGSGNPGAAALRYISNNSGAIYDVTIRSSDPNKAGAIGLDLRQGQQGPSLIKRVTIDGFDYGIETGDSFSLVFEDITVTNQRKAGIHNRMARSTIHKLSSRNRVPALMTSRHGQMTLIDADLTGGDPAAGGAAIVSGTDAMFLRDIKTAGYAHAVQANDGAFVDGPVDEWFEGQAHTLFDAPKKSLRLPIEPTPEIPWETDLSKWVKVDFTVPNSIQDAIDQAARESKTTVYFPKTTSKAEKYIISKPIRVHGSVNRIIGMENIVWIDGEGGELKDGSVVFTFEKLDGPIVIERFFNLLKLGGWKGLHGIDMFDNRSDHPVIIRNLAKGACSFNRPSTGRTWFIEDMAGGVTAQFGAGDKVWMRQYNPESPERDMCRAAGAQVWILGLKTEGRTRHVVASDSAKVEVLGGVSYQSWKNQKLDPPMFTVNDSQASFTIGFYSWNLPFTTVVEETRDGKTFSLPRKGLGGNFMPLYRAGGK